jgi:hypothetical protein
MRTSQLTSCLFRPLDLLYAALINPVRRERAAIVTLGAYLVIWTFYAVIAKSSQDIHVDMAELIVWSRDLAFGFRKHPPLAAIVVSLWFDIFSIAAWSYYLLSVSIATLALWIAWVLMADYLNAEKRVIGLALLTLIPSIIFSRLLLTSTRSSCRYGGRRPFGFCDRLKQKVRSTLRSLVLEPPPLCMQNTGQGFYYSDWQLPR